MHLYRFPADGPSKPAPELLLAQIILSAILLLLVGYATYEKEHTVATYTYHNKGPIFLKEGHRKLPINQFRASYSVLIMLIVTSAYFFISLLLYLTIKFSKNAVDLYKTNMVVYSDALFCALMLICSIAAMAHPGRRAVHSRETQILIASGISMFCCVSSGVGFYYSYRVYRGL